MRDAEWNNRQTGHADEIGRGHCAPADQPPRELAEVGGRILARAALRLPVLGFSLFYLVQGGARHAPLRERRRHAPGRYGLIYAMPIGQLMPFGPMLQ